MIVNDQLEVRMIWRHALGQNAVQTYLFNTVAATGVSPSDAEAATSVGEVIRPLYDACVASAWIYKGLKYRRVYPMPLQLVPIAHADVPGSLIGESLPPQVAQVVSLRSSSAPPRTRGRKYVPCCTETESGSGAILAAQLTRLAALADRLLQDFPVTGAGGGTLTLACGIHKGTNPSQFFRFTSRVVRANFGTQRRRSAINRSDSPEF